MKTILFLAAAAGLGFLYLTDAGRQIRGQWGGARGLVRRGLEQPHPDTAMAHAFEEAVAEA